MVDLEDADDIVLLFGELQQAQSVMNKLTEVIPTFGMHFAPSKCKVMLEDVLGLNTPLTRQRVIFEVVDRCKYLESCVSIDCSVSNEIDA